MGTEPRLVFCDYHGEHSYIFPFREGETYVRARELERYLEQRGHKAEDLEEHSFAHGIEREPRKAA